MDYRDDWQALRRKLRELFEERRDAGIWPRKKDGSFTAEGERMAYGWLVGVHAGLILSGSENGLGPLVWIGSIRGADDATRIKEDT